MNINPFHTNCPHTKKLICYCGEKEIKVRKKRISENEMLYKMFLKKFPNFRREVHVVDQQKTEMDYRITKKIRLNRDTVNKPAVFQRSTYGSHSRRSYTPSNRSRNVNPQRVYNNTQYTGSTHFITIQNPQKNFMKNLRLQWKAYYLACPKVNCTVCGSNSEPENILVCKECKKVVHITCYEDEMVENIPLEFRRQWICDSCTKCNICGVKLEEKTIKCQNCRRNFHLKCHTPSLKAFPNEKGWKCAYCKKFYVGQM